jgi:flagellar basal body rod protein FlgG
LRLVSNALAADSRSMNAISIALQGLEQADARLTAATSQIAEDGTAQSGDPGGDVVSLSEEMVALMSAQTQYSANIDSLKTADQMETTALDITG